MPMIQEWWGWKTLYQTSSLMVFLALVSVPNTIVIKIDICCARWSNMLMRKLKFTIRIWFAMIGIVVIAIVIIAIAMIARLVIIEWCGMHVISHLMCVMVFTAWATSTAAAQSVTLWVWRYCCHICNSWIGGRAEGAIRSLHDHYISGNTVLHHATANREVQILPVNQTASLANLLFRTQDSIRTEVD